MRRRKKRSKKERKEKVFHQVCIYLHGLDREGHTEDDPGQHVEKPRENQGRIQIYGALEGKGDNDG